VSTSPPAPPALASSSTGSASSCFGRRRSGLRDAGPAARPVFRRTGESAGTALQPGAAVAGTRMKWFSQISRSTSSGVVSAVSSRWMRPDSATTIASNTVFA
jgi:hypothetical protein